MGMNESPPNEADQAEDIYQEWCLKLGIEPEDDSSVSKVTLAMHCEIDRLQGFLRRYDEQFRLIAEKAGADGTSEDDWRALADKPGVALEAVRELRADYDGDGNQYYP